MRIRTNGVMDNKRAGRSVRIVNRIRTVHGNESLRLPNPGIGTRPICGGGLGGGAAARAGTGAIAATRIRRPSPEIMIRIVLKRLMFERTSLFPNPFRE